MVEIKLIGCGAAGNKAVIDAYNNGIIEHGEFVLINSTSKDIPDEFKQNSIIYSNADGAGKERSLGKKYAVKALQNKDFEIDKFVNEAKIVVLVSSLDGGTGSSSVSIFAKYIKEVLSKNVYIIGFNGFENDARSLSNTIEFMKELDKDYSISIISNKKFLSNKTNQRQAERLANKEFCQYIKTIKAVGIRDSEVNIDGAELYKTIATPGYTIIERGDISDIRNKEDFDILVRSLYDNSKSIDTDNACKRICAFVLAEDKIQNKIDFSFNEVKECWGTPFEFYQHTQNDEVNEIIFIISGMNLPIKYFEKMYNNYIEESSKVNKGIDSFFDQINKLNGNEDDSEFNSLTNNNSKKSKAEDFFSGLNIDTKDITDSSEGSF